jgi:hypothetical protein
MNLLCILSPYVYLEFPDRLGSPGTLLGRLIALSCSNPFCLTIIRILVIASLLLLISTLTLLLI